MSKARLTLHFKGGPGSGHRGHAGRPGKRGGSLPSGGVGYNPKVAIKDASQFFAALDKDERMRSIAVGLMADGTFPDIMNITESLDMSEIAGGMWTDPENEKSISRMLQETPNVFPSSTRTIVDSLQKDFEVARRGEPGWHEKSAARSQWEKKYYGRTFMDDGMGRAYEAEGWAIAKLDTFIESVLR